MATMKQREAEKLFKGRTIKEVRVNRFQTGQPNHPWTTNPYFTLDDGTRIHFTACETEVGEYGIEIAAYRDGVRLP